jgi:hypothetical protein
MTIRIKSGTTQQFRSNLSSGSGFGLLTVMRIDETYRVDANGHPRAFSVVMHIFTGDDRFDPESNT